jgi:hypothetical protein
MELELIEPHLFLALTLMPRPASRRPLLQKSEV